MILPMAGQIAAPAKRPQIFKLPSACLRIGPHIRVVVIHQVTVILDHASVGMAPDEGKRNRLLTCAAWIEGGAAQCYYGVGCAGLGIRKL